MTVVVSRQQVDQPYVQATSVNGADRVYVGDNDLALRPGGTSTIEQSLNGTSFQSVRLERRSTGSAGQNGPQTRPAVHSDGTVYAAERSNEGCANESENE